MRTPLRTFAVTDPHIAEGRLFRLLAEDGCEIYVMPVMYGYRVQSARKGDLGPSLDWCGGADLHFVALLLEIMEHLLTYHNEKELPQFSQIRPVHLDLHFMGKLASMTDPNRPPRFYHRLLDDLGEKRRQYHENLFPGHETFVKAVGGL
jgi:hypothetical protein